MINLFSVMEKIKLLLKVSKILRWETERWILIELGLNKDIINNFK